MAEPYEGRDYRAKWCFHRGPLRKKYRVVWTLQRINCLENERPEVNQGMVVTLGLGHKPQIQSEKWETFTDVGLTRAMAGGREDGENYGPDTAFLGSLRGSGWFSSFSSPLYLPHVLSQADFTFLTEENESYFLFKKREKNIDIIEGGKNPTFFFFGQLFLYLEIVSKHFPTLQSPLSIFPPP